jgi:beta-phosphoglucomutase
MLPGSWELVHHLTRLSVRQAIASSAPPRNITQILQAIGLADQFTAVVSSEEVKHGKPAPDIFLRAADVLTFPPTACVVFEDAPAGVQAGKAAGCRVVAIAAAFTVEALSGADLVVSSFAEMLWTEGKWMEFLGR